MEEVLEKMSLTTSSGKALLLRASFSSSWKNTYSRRWVTGPVAEKDLHPQHQPRGRQAQSQGALGSLPSLLNASTSLISHQPHKNPGKREKQGRLYSGHFTDGQTKA